MTPFESDLVALRPRLMAFAGKLTRDRTAAEDLYQDTVVKALTHRDKFLPGTNTAAWLMTIMRNHHLGQVKRAWRSVQMPDGLAESQSTPPVAFEAAVWSEFEDVVATMSPIMAEAILAGASGPSMEVLAETLGVSIGTAKSRLFRARTIVREAMGE